MEDNCRGEEDGGIGRKLYRYSKIPENEVPTLGRVIGTKTCDRAKSPAEVLEVFVGESSRPGPKIEGGASHGMARKVSLHTGVADLEQVEGCLGKI